MAKVYLETSFFSACVSTRTTDKSKGWRASSVEWWHDESARHDLHVSDEVIRELSDPDFPHKDEALGMVRGLAFLEISPEVQKLAELLVREQIMPGPAISGDAIHVAASTFYGMDYLLSWNVKHLANPNKRIHLAVVSSRLGSAPPLIVTPDMLQEPS